MYVAYFVPLPWFKNQVPNFRAVDLQSLEGQIRNQIGVDSVEFERFAEGGHLFWRIDVRRNDGNLVTAGSMYAQPVAVAH